MPTTSADEALGIIETLERYRILYIILLYRLQYLFFTKASFK